MVLFCIISVDRDSRSAEGICDRKTEGCQPGLNSCNKGSCFVVYISEGNTNIVYQCTFSAPTCKLKHISLVTLNHEMAGAQIVFICSGLKLDSLTHNSSFEPTESSYPQ